MFREGEVIKVHPNDSLFTVKYSDGDKEDLTLFELEQFCKKVQKYSLKGSANTTTIVPVFSTSPKNNRTFGVVNTGLSAAARRLSSTTNDPIMPVFKPKAKNNRDSGLVPNNKPPA